MDCREAEEQFVPFLLGALDSRERELMDSHLEGCPACSLKLQGDGETVARLAFAVPQLEVPPRVKQRLFARIETDARPYRQAQPGTPIMGLWESLGRALLPHGGKVVASMLALGLVFSGVWFNSRLNQVAKENEELSGQMEAAAEREADVIKRVSSQRAFVYEALRMSATPGTSVNMLWGTGHMPSARGMMMVSDTGTEALLLVLDLPSLPSDQVYQVWLISEGQKYRAEFFTVDSTGYGQAVIIPVEPFALFEGVEITIEPTGSSAGPTGNGVLKGDL